MDYVDYYATLGVDSRASEEEITRAYRKLARRYHRIRLRGQGLPAGPGQGRGDLYAEVRIVAPVRLRPEERSLYERLACLQSEGFGIRR